MSKLGETRIEPVALNPNNWNDEGAPVGLNPSLFLSGKCEPTVARWALSAFYCKPIKVSPNFFATFIPKSICEDGGEEVR